MLRWLLRLLWLSLHGKNPIDRFRGHPRKADVLELLRAKRWQELEALYAGLRRDERHVITAGSAQSAKIGAFDTWVDETKSAVARSFKGHLELDLAWRARTAVAGSLVTQEAWNKFFAHLRTAFENLRAASYLAPSDPEPLGGMIRALMGLGDHVGQMRDYFDRIEGLHLPAANYLLDALTEKWRGSHEEMFAFARTLCERNSGYGSLVALAHAERWFAAEGAEQREYFAKPDVREEILAAYGRDALLAAHDLDYFALMARSVYAFAFWQMKDRARSSEELERVGRYITEKPWAYGAMRIFNGLNAARKECGLAPIGKR